jgi:hypothetical protein
MTTSESPPPKESERLRARLLRLSRYQIAIEHEAMCLRAEVGISNFEYLPLDLAVTCLPNCEVLGLRHVPGISLQMLVHARTKAYETFGALARRDGENLQIVFNDAHPPYTVRVNAMEELFHLRLGHEPDLLTLAPRDGRYRTHDANKELEASGCATAALVPFAGLYAMLTRQTHIARIAEHFAVTVDVVHDRIGATNLGDTMTAQFRHFALVPE